MSGHNEKFKSNAVQFLLFLGLMLVLAYGFQEYVIRPMFRGAMFSLFAPPAHRNAHGDHFADEEFIFDQTNQTRTIAAHGYEKDPGVWIVKAEKLGEDPIIIEPWL